MWHIQSLAKIVLKGKGTTGQLFVAAPATANALASELLERVRNQRNSAIYAVIDLAD
jgi:hypothetical protein